MSRAHHSDCAIREIMTSAAPELPETPTPWYVYAFAGTAFGIFLYAMMFVMMAEPVHRRTSAELVADASPAAIQELERRYLITKGVLITAEKAREETYDENDEIHRTAREARSVAEAPIEAARRFQSNMEATQEQAKAAQRDRERLADADIAAIRRDFDHQQRQLGYDMDRITREGEERQRVVRAEFAAIQQRAEEDKRRNDEQAAEARAAAQRAQQSAEAVAADIARRPSYIVRYPAGTHR